MSKKGFHPDEILFAPTLRCNLSCRHCDVSRSSALLPVAAAKRFLHECKSLGVRRVGFTGGEPFLYPEFLYSLTREAVRGGFLFDRIMTNAVWWNDENDLKIALIKLFNAGYDGSICVSVDAFHKQKIGKVARFIELSIRIWSRSDIVSIASVRGARDPETRTKVESLARLLKKRCPAAVLRIYPIEIAPIGRASALKNAWSDTWFTEDYCQGPGNAFFVLSDGSVKPCCGYAHEHRELTIGNIKRDNARTILENARKNRLVRVIFNKGLSSIRKNLEKAGVKFPGKTTSHCYFCNYIPAKIPKRALAKSLAMILALFLAAVPALWARDIISGEECRCIQAAVVKKVSLPRWYHEGLFFDGKSLWLANGENGMTWIVDPLTGEVGSSIMPVCYFTEAFIRTDDGALYTTEWNAKKLYRVRLEGAKLIPEKEVSFEPAHPAGLIAAGGRIYVILWTRGMGTKFHLAILDKDLNEIERLRIRDIHEPCQLAWDGTSLWVSSWYSRTVYKIDVNTWAIAGYFRSPITKTTGIAWDGAHMWVTGTYGDLYEMEIGS